MLCCAVPISSTLSNLVLSFHFSRRSNGVQNAKATVIQMTTSGFKGATMTMTSVSSTNPCLPMEEDVSNRTIDKTCAGNEHESTLISSGPVLHWMTSIPLRLSLAFVKMEGSNFIRTGGMRMELRRS